MKAGLILILPSLLLLSGGQPPQPSADAKLEEPEIRTEAVTF